VVLNPPRTGLPAAVREWLGELLSSRPVRVAYISCDPATLARDLKDIGCRSIRTLRAYDLFPQTSHVETLAIVER
jgi:23S rRNA (uracil1939-C5)-methyltransferase